MSREEIIRMAQQSGMNIGRTNIGGSIEDLVRFAEAFRSAAAIAQPVQPVNTKITRLLSEIRGASEVVLVNARLDGTSELYKNSITRIVVAAETMAAITQPVVQPALSMSMFANKADYEAALAQPVQPATATPAGVQPTPSSVDAKDAERYRFWRDCWGREQFLTTLQRTITGLAQPLTKGDYNNFDIVSDAAITAKDAK